MVRPPRWPPERRRNPRRQHRFRGGRRRLRARRTTRHSDASQTATRFHHFETPRAFLPARPLPQVQHPRQPAHQRRSQPARRVPSPRSALALRASKPWERRCPPASPRSGSHSKAHCRCRARPRGPRGASAARLEAGPVGWSACQATTHQRTGRLETGLRETGAPVAHSPRHDTGRGRARCGPRIRITRPGRSHRSGGAPHRAPP